MTLPAPSTVRGAGWVVVLQGVAALVIAGILLVRGLIGVDQHVVNGLGTAVWFVLIGGVVLAGGRALVIGKRWGRGLAIFTQLLLLPIAWYLAVGSHRQAYGIPLGLVSLTALALLFTPAALRWAAGGDQRGPASSAKDEPDSR